MERKGVITFKNSPLTLTGDLVNIGDVAPDFVVVNQELKPVRLSDFKNELVIISSVPSLDTPVCEMQTKRFNREASLIKARILTISMDLPFAQKRFCGANEIENLMVLSDYRERDFGKKYGLLIQELQLLTRAVLMIDPSGRIAYMQIVKEVTHEPDYDDVLAKVRTLIS
ncbi:thiol peroxidase [Candidatus Sumerlaeota bacterium]|nr:thiol peroxidase [Candidatus Sumerlaeota bacterium]